MDSVQAKNLVRLGDFVRSRLDEIEEINRTISKIAHKRGGRNVGNGFIYKCKLNVVPNRGVSFVIDLPNLDMVVHLLEKRRLELQTQIDNLTPDTVLPEEEPSPGKKVPTVKRSSDEDDDDDETSDFDVEDDDDGE